MSLKKEIYFFYVCIQLCNKLNQNEYEIILISIKANLYFFFIKDSTMSIYSCNENSWHRF